MMRTAALFASSLILASCATHSSPGADLTPPQPLACDPRVKAPLEPEPPVRGTVVAPVTAAEVEATRDHLTSDAEARDWGRRGWERARIAKDVCDGPS